MLAKLLKAFKAPKPVATPHTEYVPVCAVPDCWDGYEVSRDDQLVVVECDTHNSRTTWDAVQRPHREQKVIRVQDNWAANKPIQRGGPGRAK